MDYRVTCCIHERMPNGHRHIGHVGTGDESGYSQLWSLREVLAAIQVGHHFYTLSRSTGRTAWVDSYYCPQCQGTTLRSSPDAVTDNNLDNLPTCQR